MQLQVRGVRSSVCGRITYKDLWMRTDCGLKIWKFCILDLDFGIRNWILKFADDTKIFSRINNINSLDSERLQSDLHLLQLIRWSEEWQMLFNVNKCKVVHIGKQNQQRQYFMHDQCLEVVCQEKDLGILISNDLKGNQ